MSYEVELTSKAQELFIYEVVLSQPKQPSPLKMHNVKDEDRTVICPSCNSPATKINLLNKYYCFTCKRYV
jgi:hypothetical protein